MIWLRLLIVGRIGFQRARQQDQNGVRRGFFQRLEQRILRARLRRVEIAENGDAVARLERLERQPLHHAANFLDLERAGFRLALGVKDVGVVAADDAAARRTLAARLMIGIGAVERHGEGARQRLLADRLRADDQVRLADPPMRDALAQMFDRPVMPVNVPVCLDSCGIFYRVS